MRPGGIALLTCALAAAACNRELRSVNHDAWFELTTEHFTLRTDLDEPDARRAIADLELLRNALLAAGWHTKSMSGARIFVVELLNERELHEFVHDGLIGVTASGDRFGDRLILAGDGPGLLDSEVMKHELAHALLAGFLRTNPRWVQEGIASYLEAVTVDREKGKAVGGKMAGHRLNALRNYRSDRVDWFSDVIGLNVEVSDRAEYSYETLACALIHWMADERPDEFRKFLTRLASGDGMWTAFAVAFPNLDQEGLKSAMSKYVVARDFRKETVDVPPWTGTAAVRKLPPAEVHALRAQLYEAFWRSARVDHAADFRRELAAAKALDPANPLALALSKDPDRRLATERHPEDYRSWLLWFEAHADDHEAIRKAVALAPDNAYALALLAEIEQDEGKTKEAIEHAERARVNGPGFLSLVVLSEIYDKNGRCPDALAAQQQALDGLGADAEKKWPAGFAAHLASLQARCGKDGAAPFTVEAEPVLQKCSRRPKSGTAAGVWASFTIREDGTVTDVVLQGAPEALSKELRSSVESCSFDPVLIGGKPRRAKLKMKLEDLLQ
jgi:Protein of unknown function (DUF1570)